MNDDVFTFTSTEELLEQAEEDGACLEALEWCKGKTLDEIFRHAPFGWRLWALACGYIQFAKNCPWEKLNGWDWGSLLRLQPRFARYCDWEKLNAYDWYDILSEQSQLAKYCNLEKLDSRDRRWLLREYPYLAKYMPSELGKE